ncbi:hypothetical protein DV713_04590 [Parageobacillus thermoglucosidasius]|nr:hypothetical protein DV713_04590 [Parageobacillus thermoglucosidasius]
MIADAVALPVYNKNKVLAEETKDGKTSCGLCLPTAAGKLTRKFRLFTSMICLFVLLFFCVAFQGKRIPNFLQSLCAPQLPFISLYGRPLL